MIAFILIVIFVAVIATVIESNSKETWEDRMIDQMRYEDARKKGLLP